MEVRYPVRNGGFLVMSLALASGEKIDPEAHEAFIHHARSFTPAGNPSRDRSNACFVRDQLRIQGYLANTLRDVYYEPPLHQAAQKYTTLASA